MEEMETAYSTLCVVWSTYFVTTHNYHGAVIGAAKTSGVLAHRVSPVNMEEARAMHTKHCKNKTTTRKRHGPAFEVAQCF